MVRIIAGEFRSRRLVSPPSHSVRPTADRVKESLFEIIRASPPGASVLDLYAGCGNLGLEALSRGAARCLFVERSSACCALIRRNIEILGLGDKARVMRMDCARAVKLLAAKGERYDLVFADPPYAKVAGRESESKKILRVLEGYDTFAPQARVVIEHFKGDVLREDFLRLVLLGQRRYGDTMVSFFEVKGVTTDLSEASSK